MVEVLEHRPWVVARKEHACDSCGLPILRGMAYALTTCKDGGPPYRWREHMKCHEWANEFIGPGEVVDPGALREEALGGNPSARATLRVVKGLIARGLSIEAMRDRDDLKEWREQAPIPEVTCNACQHFRPWRTTLANGECRGPLPLAYRHAPPSHVPGDEDATTCPAYKAREGEHKGGA